MGYHIRRGIILILVLLIMLNLFLSISIQRASGPTILPIATISLLQTSQTADVSPNGTGMVGFDGEVYCECATGTSAIVSLTATDTWNSANISPTALQFTSDDPGPKNFYVTVKAPLYTSSNTYGTVTVTGKVVMYPSTLIGTTQPSGGITGRIDIAPYYRFFLKSDKITNHTTPGSMTQYNLFINNGANSRDTFTICESGCEDLINDGFQILLDYRAIDIEELETRKVEIQVNVPKSDKYKERIIGIAIEVTSMGCLNTNETSVACQSITFKLDTRTRSGGGSGNDGDDNILGIQKPKESTKGFLPGFETLSLIFCIVIIILFRKSIKYKDKR